MVLSLDCTRRIKVIIRLSPTTAKYWCSLRCNKVFSNKRFVYITSQLYVDTNYYLDVSRTFVSLVYMLVLQGRSATCDDPTVPCSGRTPPLPQLHQLPRPPGGQDPGGGSCHSVQSAVARWGYLDYTFTLYAQICNCCLFDVWLMVHSRKVPIIAVCHKHKHCYLVPVD